MKRLCFITFFILITSCVNNEENILVPLIDITEDVVIPKHYIVTKTKSPIIIDGLPNDEAWERATFTSNFIDIEGIKTPKYDTKVKMLWDETFLYVFARLEEPHIWGDITQRDQIIYLNNDFEVFIDPSQTGYGYGEIEINALNTVWDLYLDKPYRSGGKANFQWNLNNLKSAVHVEGSVNNPLDKDEFWAVEMAIPLKPYVSLKNRPKTLPKEGEQWKLNFSRVQWDFDIVEGKYQRKKENNKFLREYNWVWSNQKVINMHEPEKWGILQFTENASSENVLYNEDTDLMTKQAAYALYRNTAFKNLKSYLELPRGSSKILRVKHTQSDTLDVEFFKTNFGFEYLVKSNVSKKSFLINEQGILKTL